MKRIINGMIAGMTALCVIIGLTGCGVEKRLPEYDNEYFRYAVRTYRDGSQEGYLVGFTESGAAQTELILPQEIDGIPIVNFGYWLSGPFGDNYGQIGQFFSENLRKIYVPFVPAENTWASYRGTISDIPNAYLVIWKSKDITSWSALRGAKGEIVGFNILVNYFDWFAYGNATAGGKIANISYMYNYERAEDDGYYWVDSYDNKAVSFIPPAPAREGYSFGGWYKEAECFHAWDFAKDRTGDEIVIESYSKYEDYKDREITYLYAKWNKEN